MPDAPEWGDAGADTFGHICESREVRLPNLESLGLGNIRPLKGVEKIAKPRGAYGKCALASNGKDTTTGHWEMAGIILGARFPNLPQRLSQISHRSVRRADKSAGILGNIAASGTEIIKDLGAEHVRTGKPIVIRQPIQSSRLPRTKK